MYSNTLLLSTILSLTVLGLLPSALADRGTMPDDELFCFERIQADGMILCGLLDKPFESMLEAYNPIFQDLTIAVLWGIIMAVLWMKVQNTALVGIVGLVIAGSVVGLSPESFRVGLLLVAVSMGIILFQLVQQRIQYPQ